MATSTIGQLTLATSAAAGDFIEIETAAGVSRRITKANFIGAALAGGGIINTGGFTLTVPATGTAALLGAAQSFSALNTFAAGLSFGENTLDKYKTDAWIPELLYGGANVGLSYWERAGQYTRIGNMVVVWGRIWVNSKGSSTGAVTISGLPFTARSVAGLDYPLLVRVQGGLSYTGTLQGHIAGGATAIQLSVSNGGTVADATESTWPNNGRMTFLTAYLVA